MTSKLASVPFGTTPPTSTAVARGKLAPPHLAFRPVLSRSAETLLRSAALAKLVTVSAPAGYGKTVVMHRLHQTLVQRGQRCIWVTLDDRDVAVSSVLYLVQAAAAAAGLSAAEDTHLDTRPVGDDPRGGMDRLVHLLERVGERTTLFVDNLSFCTDPLLPMLLQRLIFDSAQDVRLVLSGTERLPLDATRAKLELGSVDLQAHHLAFDTECTTIFLAQAGLANDSAIVQRVQALTEGWPAAVRLVQVLMQEAGNTDEVLARFSGADHDVADVLTRRVLSGFDVAQVNFLLEIAPLREFSAELAEHVTGRPQAPEWIDGLLKRNVLIFPLDRAHDWLRMHTLLRQYLIAEGKRRVPRERRREILERAAEWLSDRGDDIAALEAALDAPAPTLAGRLLDRVAREVAGAQGRLSLYTRWVEQLLGSGVTLSLEAQTWYVWSLCFTLQYERAHRAMDALDHRLAEADPHGSIRGLQARLGLLRVVVSTYLDLMETAREEAGRWLAHSATRDPLAVATVASAAAVAELACDDREAARKNMRLAATAITRSQSAYGHAWVSLVEACVHLRDGEPLAADRLLSQARPLAVHALGDDASVVGTIDFVHARALVDLGRVEAGRQKATRGLAQAAHHGICETSIQGFSACVALWDGGEDGPFALDALESIARSYPTRAQRALHVLQMQRLLSLGRAAEARALARRQLLQFEEPQRGSEALLEQFVSLQLHAAEGEPRAAERCEAAIKAMDRRTRPREAIRLNLLHATMLFQTGNVRAAARALTTGIALASRRQLLGPFLECAPLIGELLSRTTDRELALTVPDELKMLARLRQTLGATPQSESVAEFAANTQVDAGPAESLTPREIELLELLDHGMSNQQIADRTALSLATVKWHLYNLYGKLQVKSRSAALARARTLQVIRR